VSRPPRPLAPLRAAVFAAALIALAPGAARPQGAPESTAPEEAAKPEPPQPIPLAEVATRAQALEGRLRELAKEGETGDLEANLTTALPELVQRLGEREAALGKTLAATRSLAELDALAISWRQTQKRIAEQSQPLEKRIEQLDTRLAELDRLAAVWSVTAEQLRAAGAPPEVLERVAATRKRIAETRSGLQEGRNRLLQLESRLGELESRVETSLARIDEANQAILSQIFARDSEPLWLARPGSDYARAWEELRSRTTTSASEVLAYGGRYGDRFLFQLVATLAFVWGLRRARTRLEERRGRTPSPAPQEDAARDLLRHPVAAALVLGLALSLFLHTDAPRSVLQLVGILVLLPLVVVVHAIVPLSLRSLLYGVAALYFVDRVRDLLAPFELAGRWIFLVEVAFGVGGLAWLLRSTRLRALPAEFGHSVWARPLSLWMRVSLAALGVALLAGVVGYVRLALLLGRAVLSSAYLALVLLAAVWISDELLEVAFRSRLLTRLHMVRRDPTRFVRWGSRVLRAGAVLTWGWFVLDALAIRNPLLDALGPALSYPIGYGSFSLSIGGVIAFALTVWLAWLLSRFVSFALENEVYPRVALPRGVPFALSSLTRYTVIVLGFLVAVAMLGFDLDRLTLLAGALGVGIGFGLQNVVNNFVSGLILLFERPVQVGDRIEMGAIMGDVKRIGIRASIVRTFDGAEVIVPNANLISDLVTNWTLGDRLRRLILPVGVAYGTDPERVLEILVGVGREHPDLLEEPPVVALFRGFGESSLDFELRGWTENYDSRLRILSDLAVATNRAFREAGIEIPFPQRDLHLRSVSPGARGAFGGGEPSAGDEPDAPQ
jgi:potassium efflux system protein